MDLSYLAFGKGEPLVFLHGLGSRKEAWESQYSLAKHFRLIIPDLRGHGESPIGDQPLSIQQFAQDVLELMDTLHIDTFHLCGLSMGGLVAQHIATSTDRVQSLILANTASFIPYIPGEFYALMRAYLFTLLEHDHYTSRVAKMCLYNSDDIRLFTKAKKALYCRPDSYIATTKLVVGVSYREKLKDLQVPTLLIGSQFDLVTPLFAMIDMEQIIPNSRLVILRNAGHMSNIDKTEEFNRHVLNFLKSMKRGNSEDQTGTL